MRITWVPSILLALSVLPIHSQTIEQAIPQGRIRGVVVDEEGKPIQHAEVWPHVRHPTIGALRFVETDANGRFEIDRLEFDTFNVFAKKEDEEYPDMGFAFYYEGLPHIVRLSPDEPVANANLKIGPKAGVLTGSVTDKVTGKAIDPAFMLRRAKNPANFLSTSGASQYRLLLPPETEVTLEVSADGYETWLYTDPSDSLKPMPIRLASGAEMRLDIQLQPTGLHGVFANPHAERIVVRPGIVMAAVYGKDHTPCEMQIEPEQPISSADEPAYMDSDVVTQILSEVMPEEKRGRRTGDFNVETPDGIQTHGVGYEKMTISYSATKEGWRTKPPQEVRVTIQSSDGIACSDLAN